MTDKTFHDRPYQAFLSHAHADKPIVDRLYRWLTETAGLPIWYDSTDLPAGARIATELGNALPQCKAAIILLSKRSIASGWVEDEWNIASNERNLPVNNGEFRIVPIRIEECDVPPFLKATTYIDFTTTTDELAAYAKLLSVFYGNDSESQPDKIDIYVSRSWRSGNEQLLPDYVCKKLAGANFRLIGDSPDWPNFEDKRIRMIVRSCTGLISIIPNRPTEKLKYFVEEINAARDLRLPSLVVADAEATLPEDIAKFAVRVPIEGSNIRPAAEHQIAEEIEDFVETCRMEARPQHVFLATELDEQTTARNRIIQRLVQRITGLSCVIGEKINSDGIQKAIIQRISMAVAMIADISGDKLNICIEAGVARGARVPLHLIAQGERRSPPFMLRDIEPAFYLNDLELLGVAHRIARSYRRKVLSFDGSR